MTTIIIGAGASGLAAAIALKQSTPNEKVIILERLPSPGKKILATGNGRCNLTNKNAEGFERTKLFFNSTGLILREEEQGRIYPYSLKAQTVLDTLLEASEKLGVKIITDCEVTKLGRDLTVNSSKGSFMADSVIVAAGGKAQKNLGSNGSGYALLKPLGHSVAPLSPALVQLTSSSKYPRAIKGTRTRCNIKIEIGGEIKGEEYGEILFTEYGLSGIAAMDLSHIVSGNFSKEKPEKCVAVLDLAPEISEAELKNYMEDFGSLRGIFGEALSNIILKQALNNTETAAKIAKSWRLIITGTKGFDFAQITNGGIPLNEVDGFESKYVKDLYICGELLDKQFPCGGFNLDFAWTSGIAAAEKIAEKRNDKNK
ncbi:MAG: aminoacetone oxidase family FAD-binding enzyme [Eubacterium sp.]|nr:aminoacetone oxidase family FAD-binding enzyme [Eubacterium sp.]